MQSTQNRSVKQDSHRRLLCELQRVGVDLAEKEESILLLSPFTRTPRFLDWKTGRTGGPGALLVRMLLSRKTSAVRWEGDRFNVPPWKADTHSGPRAWKDRLSLRPYVVCCLETLSNFWTGVSISILHGALRAVLLTGDGRVEPGSPLEFCAPQVWRRRSQP